MANLKSRQHICTGSHSKTNEGLDTGGGNDYNFNDYYNTSQHNTNTNIIIVESTR